MVPLRVFTAAQAGDTQHQCPASLYLRAAPVRVCVFVCVHMPPTDLALQLPDVVETMLAKMQAEQLTVYDPDRGKSDQKAYCNQVVHNRGYYGPWMHNS